MAILHNKEEKIQAVIGRLPKTYTHEQFVEMFIKLYSKDWGKIKSAYIKQSQDKEPGTVINMPKPDLYLKQLAEIYIQANPPKAVAVTKSVVAKEPVAEQTKAILAEAKEIKVSKTKTTKTAIPKAVTEAPLKVKAPAKTKVAKAVESAEVAKKTKVVAKKKTISEDVAAVEIEKKPKVVAKKVATGTTTPVTKKTKAVKN